MTEATHRVVHRAGLVFTAAWVVVWGSAAAIWGLSAVSQPTCMWGCIVASLAHILSHWRLGVLCASLGGLIALWIYWDE